MRSVYRPCATVPSPHLERAIQERDGDQPRHVQAEEHQDAVAGSTEATKAAAAETEDKQQPQVERRGGLDGLLMPEMDVTAKPEEKQENASNDPDASGDKGEQTQQQ